MCGDTHSQCQNNKTSLDAGWPVTESAMEQGFSNGEGTRRQREHSTLHSTATHASVRAKVRRPAPRQGNQRNAIKDITSAHYCCQLRASARPHFRNTMTLPATVSFLNFKEYYIKAITYLPAMIPLSLIATLHFINTSHRQAKLIQGNFIVFRHYLTFVRNYLYHLIAKAERNQNNYLKTEVYKF